MDFSALDFGEADAETESRDKAILLTKGFFDPFDIARRILNREVTVLLGAKGSGKSSVIEHLRLTASHDSFFRTIYVSDMPFSDFVKVKLGDSSPETRAPTAWKFFILSYLLESLATDPRLECAGGPDVMRKALSSLEDVGARPRKDFRNTILHLSRVTTKVALPFNIGETEATIDRVPAAPRIFLASAAEQLVRLVERTHSPNRHILFVDGLDEFFRPSRGVQDEVIGGLVFAAHQLNRRFRDVGAPCIVVVACRTEIFDRLPLSDSNRIKQTSGAVVDWAVNEDEAYNSLLFDLVDHKVKAKARRHLRSVVSDYFPTNVAVGKDGNYEIDAYDYLLDRTRRTPRDLLRLLEHIRRAVPRGKLPSNREINIGAREYARNYFLGEVRNELTSTCDKTAAEELIHRISRLDGHIFRKDDLSPGTLPSGIDLFETLEALYQAGAIGYTSRGSYYNFRYRNEAIGFSDSTELVLHNALITALNIPRGRATPLTG